MGYSEDFKKKFWELLSKGHQTAADVGSDGKVTVLEATVTPETAIAALEGVMDLMGTQRFFDEFIAAYKSELKMAVPWVEKCLESSDDGSERNEIEKWLKRRGTRPSD